MKFLNKILNVLILLAFVFVALKSLMSTDHGQQSEPKYNLTLSLENVKNYYPEADSIVLEDMNLYNVFDDGNQVGIIVNTSPYSDEIYGYNSITPLNIFLNADDEIFEVEICENRESWGYLKKVINNGFLDSWDGLTPEEAANHHVDAVSGCTYSSTAIAQSLQIRMQQLSQQKGRIYSWDWSLFVRQMCVFAVTILALICFFNPKRSALRKITLLLSIIVLGFWTNSLLSLALFFNWITNGVSLAIQIPILIVAALSILLPLFTKKAFYCQYLCPFGAAQEFVGMIPIKRQRTTDYGQQTSFKKTNSSDVEIVETTTRFGRLRGYIKANFFKFFAVLRRLFLLALLIIAALGLGLDLSVVEPFPIFNYQSIGFGIAIFAAVILIMSIFIKKPWCNYLCPTGTLLEIFRKI